MCGHAFTREEAASQAGDGVMLSAMRPGATGIVSEIRATPSRVDKLAALGVLPGVEVRVQQNQPVVVVELGETVLAIERELAEGILVSPT
jgi:Fe2+ transport system protein FeoA